MLKHSVKRLQKTGESLFASPCASWHWGADFLTLIRVILSEFNNYNP